MRFSPRMPEDSLGGMPSRGGHPFISSPRLPPNPPPSKPYSMPFIEEGGGRGERPREGHCMLSRGSPCGDEDEEGGGGMPPGSQSVLSGIGGPIRSDNLSLRRGSLLPLRASPLPLRMSPRPSSCGGGFLLRLPPTTRPASLRPPVNDDGASLSPGRPCQSPISHSSPPLSRRQSRFPLSSPSPSEAGDDDPCCWPLPREKEARPSPGC